LTRRWSKKRMEESSSPNEDFFQDKTLLKFLLREKKDLLESDEIYCQQYIEKLASYGLSRLGGEPSRLQEEQDILLEQTQALAYDNYQTFIQAADCSKNVFKDFNIIEENLNGLIDNVPLFTHKTEEFAKESQEINACRKQNSLVLSRHTQLLEILEIPQLMDTCVRNGYYEEALELSNFVKRLGKKFSTIKIISDIHNEVSRCTQYMLNQLLQQLKGNVQLPACLRIISYIRQLDVFKEAELRITFLQARESWFKDLLSQISTSDGYQHISKVIEINRVNLFDVITQYKAIFSDDQPLYYLDNEKHVNYAHILQSWVIQKISMFLVTLQEDLNQGVGGRLDSIYAQCMYFGLSFSRIGADFRGLVIPLFHKYAWNQFDTTINKTTHRFEDDIHTFNLTSKTLSRKSSNTNKISQLDASTPPHVLLEFQPIALYLNGVLSAFNNLRQYASMSMVYRVKDALCKSLEKILTSLQNWARLEFQSLQSNKADVPYYCTLVCRSLLPYLKLVFETFFSIYNLQNMIGRLPANENGRQIKSSYTFEIRNYFNYLKDFVDVNSLYDILDTKSISSDIDEADSLVDTSVKDKGESIKNIIVDKSIAGVVHNDTKDNDAEIQTALDS